MEERTNGNLKFKNITNKVIHSKLVVTCGKEIFCQSFLTKKNQQPSSHTLPEVEGWVHLC